MSKLLDSHDHYCFHSPVGNLHTRPNLHHCIEQGCPGAIAETVARNAGHVDEDGNVTCPCCGCDTYPSGERKVLEIHAQLCTDPTIHYPEWRKDGRVTEEEFQTWKATLSRDELLGRYKRVPDVHLTVQFHDDEVEHAQTDPTSFNVVLQERLRQGAETALLHQVPHRHTTTTHVVAV